MAPTQNITTSKKLDIGLLRVGKITDYCGSSLLGIH